MNHCSTELGSNPMRQHTTSTPEPLTPRYGAQSAADAKAALAMAAKVEEEETKALEPWTGEPTNQEELMDRYIIEAKCSGRTPGTTLFLVQSKFRDGSESQVLEGQRFKLFLVSWLSYRNNLM